MNWMVCTLGILAFWAGDPLRGLSQDLPTPGGSPAAMTPTPKVSSSNTGFETQSRESTTLFADPGAYGPVMDRFESETRAQVEKLNSIKLIQEKMQVQIQILESKAQTLRDRNRSSLNVFEDAKLKGTLGELQQKLAENSRLEKQYQVYRNDFEQKALSLIAFYNDWIEANLTPPKNPSPSALDERLMGLIRVVKKRTILQDLLRHYGTPEEKEPKYKTTDFKGLDPSDEEGKRMAMDLLRDRKKNISDRLDRLSLEEDEIKNEIKLQGKLQDFMEDIQRMNEDSSFPRGSLRRNDIQGYFGDKSRNVLGERLSQLEKEIGIDQQILAQMNASIARLESGAGEKEEIAHEVKTGDPFAHPLGAFLIVHPLAWTGG